VAAQAGQLKRGSSSDCPSGGSSGSSSGAAQTAAKFKGRRFLALAERLRKNISRRPACGVRRF